MFELRFESGEIRNRLFLGRSVRRDEISSPERLFFQLDPPYRRSSGSPINVQVNSRLSTVEVNSDNRLSISSRYYYYTCSFGRPDFINSHHRDDRYRYFFTLLRFIKTIHYLMKNLQRDKISTVEYVKEGVSNKITSRHSVQHKKKENTLKRV